MMQEKQIVIQEGLSGVIATETKLSQVNGEKGELIIAGHTLQSLATHTTFEKMICLLWQEKFSSTALEENTICTLLGEAREQAYTYLPSLGDALKIPDAMSSLRASMSQIKNAADTLEDWLLHVAAVAVFSAAWTRKRKNLEPVSPDKTLSHATDYLRMLRGESPSAAEAKSLEMYLVTVVEHGMNASTFTARVVASTGSDITSAIVAAIGALKGPLHGGAPGPVLDMLHEINSPENASSWLLNSLSCGKRIMGMGHRVYRVRDPRAAVLEKALHFLETNQKGISNRLNLARAVEKEAQNLLSQKYPKRSLRANVEFYTAVLLDALKIPVPLFSPTFSVGRVVGWCAHIGEQQKNGRLIRPSSHYTGPLP